MRNECEDLVVSIPCELADRARKYGAEINTDMSALMVEALDAFLRKATQ